MSISYHEAMFAQFLYQLMLRFRWRNVVKVFFEEERPEFSFAFEHRHTALFKYTSLIVAHMVSVVQAGKVSCRL